MTYPNFKKLIKVAIADDHALFRAGVKTALSQKIDIELIAEADNGLELLKLLQDKEPDVVLLDIQMPVMDGVTALPEIRKLYPSVKIIVLSMHNEHSMISRLMEIGANAYLTKNTDSDTIYEAIKTCVEQDFYFDELTNKALLSGLRSKRANLDMHDDRLLSEKEVRALTLLCEEKSTREIAVILGISPRTVEAIRDKLKLKTGAKTMAGLVTYAIKHGIFKAED
ncbi:MAG: response regulator transcription factor [Chitinophagaceae bacterium]